MYVFISYQLRSFVVNEISLNPSRSLQETVLTRQAQPSPLSFPKI